MASSDSLSSDDDETAMIEKKYGLVEMPIPGEALLEDKNPGFHWDGFSQAQETMLQNAQLKRSIQEKKYEIERLQILMMAVEPVPGLVSHHLLS